MDGRWKRFIRVGRCGTPRSCSSKYGGGNSIIGGEVACLPLGLALEIGGGCSIVGGKVACIFESIVRLVGEDGVEVQIINKTC